MSKLVWNDANKRFYEAGVDRGVLFAPGHDGVAWSGLVSVNESPVGGGPKAFYIDGYKYHQVLGSSEFEATIEAYTAPKEFDECDGKKMVRLGLFATEQPRKSFNFSYRTLIGNVDEGLDYGYKIHLVYNALARPSQKNNQTVGASLDPIVFSWSITTVALIFPGFKPTAHLVIDSRTTPEQTLRDIERALYGTSNSAPHIPSVSEIVALYDLYI